MGSSSRIPGAPSAQTAAVRSPASVRSTQTSPDSLHLVKRVFLEQAMATNLS